MRHAPVLCFMAVTVAGCGKAPAASQQVTAESVQPGGTAFTTMRPLTAADTARPESTAKPATPPLAPTGWPQVQITYYGAHARVVVTTPDGRELSDTTAPRDARCDNFDDHGEDVGCNSQDRALMAINAPSGDAYVEFSTSDTGSIWFGIEAYRGAETNRYWHGLEFRVGRWRVYRFRVTLPVPNSRDSLRVESVSGAIDTIPPPRVDPDSIRG